MNVEYTTDPLLKILASAQSGAPEEHCRSWYSLGCLHKYVYSTTPNCVTTDYSVHVKLSENEPQHVPEVWKALLECVDLTHISCDMADPSLQSFLFWESQTGALH